MVSRPCPTCQHDAPRLLQGITEIALVIYYRCNACGTVFSVPKHDPAAPPVIVTPGKKP
jgi:uncharacterized Zn finger protein